MKYQVTLNYVAQYTTIVDVDNNAHEPEGVALDKARKQAENADMSEFMLGVEQETSTSRLE